MRTLIGCAAVVLSIVSAARGGGDDPRQVKARPVIDKAIAYLRSQQDKDSSGWAVPKEGPAYPAITALVLNGMLMDKGIAATDPTVKAGVAFVLKYKQPDGGLYDKILPSYNTSICLSMLSRVDTPEAKAAIKPAQEFLKSLQFGDGAMVDGQFAKETGRVGKDHPFYGGVGYGRSGRPDNSNLNFFLQAMSDSGLPENDPAIQRALVFLKRTQMLGSVNDLDFAKGSTQGGFIYANAAGKDSVGRGQSYGGEIAESLSGPPGTEATISLLAGPDGKPRTLKRDDITARVRKAMADAAVAEVKAAADVAMILVGPGNGESSERFEVRAPVGKPDTLAAVLRQAFTADGKPEAKIDAKAVPAWKGVSRLRAYGSMTYAGFKSYVYAKLPRNDERVTAAYDWIRRNYTVAENPGAGTDGLYYFYVTFARALDAWGEPMIEVIRADGSKESRDWALDLIDHLATLQNPDGSFKSVDDRWMENNPVLITAYALIALEHAAK
jgi:hypothetical protein